VISKRPWTATARPSRPKLPTHHKPVWIYSLRKFARRCPTAKALTSAGLLSARRL
jgi:hypothetical protein